MKAKPRFEYNSGYVKVYREREIDRSDFNAPINPSSLDNMDMFVKLAFKEMSRRESDYEFAQSLDRSLTLKIKTPLREAVKVHHQAVIENVLYDIFELDYDRTKQEMYFYLEEVRTIVA